MRKIFQWTDSRLTNTSYRLLFDGQVFMVERLGYDGLGAEKWTQVKEWPLLGKEGEGIQTLLADAMVQMEAEFAKMYRRRIHE